MPKLSVNQQIYPRTNHLPQSSGKNGLSNQPLLQNPSYYQDPNQPMMVYPVEKAWEQVVKDGPVWLGKYPPSPKLYRFLGRDLISPIAVGAGPASGKLWTDFYFKMGFGLVMQKTMRTIPRSSNKAPNIAFVNVAEPIKRSDLGKPLTASIDPTDFAKYKSITNSFGNPSPDISTWAAELAQQKLAAKPGQLFACSVTATFPGAGEGCIVFLGDSPPAALIVETASDLLMAATAAALAGVDVVELNLACPNVTENPQEGEMFQNGKLVAYTLAEFKRRFPKTSIGIKFGIYKSKDQMKKVFAEAGDNLDYVSGINAIASTVVGEDGEDILPGRRVSGVAGKADQIIALEHIKWAAEIRQEESLKYEILGGGGIIEVEDVDRYLSEGADMVQVSTIALADPLFAYKYNLHQLQLSATP